jgi:hypothetical protein
MLSTPVVGNGPLEFTNSKGHEVSIPLSALNLTAGVLHSSDPVWDTALTTPPGQALAKYMVAAGLISPKPAPAPFPAMVIRAATAGSAGNNISVTVTVSSAPPSPPINDPMFTPFSLQVTETDTYAGQTAATIAGTLSGAGGLVQIVGPVDTSAMPTAQGGLVNSSGQFPVMGNGSPGGLVFVLATKGSGTDSLKTNVNITLDAGGKTFTLQVSWTKTVNNITLGTLESTVLSALGYEITVSKPSSGAYSVPATTTTPTTLSGGSSSSSASAILFTGV